MTFLGISDNLNSLNIHDFIKSEVNYILNRHYLQYIDRVLDVENIEINMNNIVPLGLIINELITNSIKHAETTNNRPLFLELNTTKKDKNIEIIYSDNGINFKSITNPNSLGLYIIDGMINQISGNYNRENSTYTFTIPYAEQQLQHINY